MLIFLISAAGTHSSGDRRQGIAAARRKGPNRSTPSVVLIHHVDVAAGLIQVLQGADFSLLHFLDEE